MAKTIDRTSEVNNSQISIETNKSQYSKSVNTEAGESPCCWKSALNAL